jgi:hypothetical protein
MQKRGDRLGVMEMMLMPATRKDQVERTNRRGVDAEERKRRGPRLGADRHDVIDFRQRVQPRSVFCVVRMLALPVRALGGHHAPGRNPRFPVPGSIGSGVIRFGRLNPGEDLERGDGVAKDVQFHPRHPQYDDKELENSHWPTRTAPHGRDPGR